MPSSSQSNAAQRTQVDVSLNSGGILAGTAIINVDKHVHILCCHCAIVGQTADAEPDPGKLYCTGTLASSTESNRSAPIAAADRMANNGVQLWCLDRYDPCCSVEVGTC
jgi:hypothetical protein